MKNCISGICFLLVLALTTPVGAAGGQDCYNMNCGASHHDFSANPIPADFFGPGSDPFDGRVALAGGQPDPSGDVVVQRLEDFSFAGIPSSDTVQIQLVQLNLVSCEPITVSYGTTPPELWNVKFSLMPTAPSMGQMTATKTHMHGGMCESFFDVYMKVEFTKVGNPSVTRSLTDSRVLSTVEPCQWRDTSPKPNPPCDGNGFWIDPIANVVFASATNDVEWYLLPPKPSSPFVALDTKAQWTEALQNGSVAPMSMTEWGNYMSQWLAHMMPGTDPYPYPNTFSSPDLYAWDPDDADCKVQVDPEWPDSAGLVMAWDRAQGQNYSAAWKYTYPADPDLTNTVITVTVKPPCIGITVVSLGLRDINGNIRAWYWNVPATLPCGVPTTVTIDTSIAPPGPGSASPVADGFLNNAAFDITKVTALLFDENSYWVGGTTAPPPGTTVPRAWNYWYDLIITPNTDKTIGPLKWSQPIQETTVGVILGWDEKSIRYERPLMADDWECKDPRPVTDIHWWGSFLKWMEPDLPPQAPIGFHFGIWTDTPKNPSNTQSFSHPNELIWQYTSYNVQCNFAGYDKDPRSDYTSSGVLADNWLNGTTTTFNPAVGDSCFQFNCDIPQASWFKQEPITVNKGRVYWLSIAAIYPSGTTTPEYPWGWKTRPKFYNDDAVRILQLQTTGWPPSLGAKWLSGETVEFPQGISWDLAFELTTNKDEPQDTFFDLHPDGIINFKDFAHLASQWLLTVDDWRMLP